MLKKITPQNINTNRTQAFDDTTIATVRDMLAQLEQGGDETVRAYAIKFGELKEGEDILLESAALKAAFDSLPTTDQDVLRRTADRIRAFALAQRGALQDLRFDVAGGVAGHQFLPVDVAGCYAPGGRFPLPSSVLMVAIPARAAGVKTLVLASPKPTAHTLAAAYLAGCDYFLRVGGVQAMAAFANGTAYTPACDVIVGPGNRWVTAAKQLLSVRVGIDMLAGPSELAVLADDSADAAVIAADLLAQAEHDTDALPILVTTSDALVDAVNAELRVQLETLPTKETALPALENGYAAVCADMDAAIDVCNRLAAEHLQVLTRDAQSVAARLRHAGGIFIGQNSAEVVGDYGTGPNHTLPTGGTAKYKAGLSVLNFLRARTFIDIDDRVAATQLYQDAAALGRMEGLEGHARAAEKRLGGNA